MSKRNAVSYVKPKDPSFLAKLKQDIGYKELHPTVDTKRQKPNADFGSDDDEERPEREDERPQIVVLAEGDLTAEEVAIEQQQQQQLKLGAIESSVADLQKPIIFRHRGERKEDKNHQKSESETQEKRQATKEKSAKENKKKVREKKSKKINHSKLSFDFEEEENENGEDN